VHFKAIQHQRLKCLSLGDESGKSLLVVLLLLVSSVPVAYDLASKISGHMKLGKSIEVADEVRSLQRIIKYSMNCRKTLNLSFGTPQPLSCSAFTNLVPRTMDGAPIAAGGKIGNWTIRARCINNSIVVGASRGGKDPLTGVDFSTKAYADDIFEGKSSFCSEYFAPGSSCPTAPYTLYYGSTSDGPQCCRTVTDLNQDMSGPRIAKAVCRPDEFMAYGYSSCDPIDTGFVFPAHVNQRYKEAYGLGTALGAGLYWQTDCFSSAGSGYLDVWSSATAVCCLMDPARR
jgi:hypothetical protein